jgi:hypothetical protein
MPLFEVPALSETIEVFLFTFEHAFHKCFCGLTQRFVVSLKGGCPWQTIIPCSHMVELVCLYKKHPSEYCVQLNPNSSSQSHSKSLLWSSSSFLCSLDWLGTICGQQVAWHAPAPINNCSIQKIYLLPIRMVVGLASNEPVDGFGKEENIKISTRYDW